MRSSASIGSDEVVRIVEPDEDRGDARQADQQHDARDGVSASGDREDADAGRDLARQDRYACDAVTHPFRKPHGEALRPTHAARDQR